MVISAAAKIGLLFFALFLSSFIFFSSFEMSSYNESLSMGVARMHSPDNTTRMLTAKFPKIIHTMWKSPKSPPPAETLRWKKGCKAINPDHKFSMYYDADLYEFVKRSYPEYLALYESLKGVYMADMARVLVIYHYGGIYMDLDFYCHRPFSCIVSSMLPSTEAVRFEKDILIVSLEPAIHANIFRDKDRVVIQDFYMATARHPFFKWFLDDRLQKFNNDPLHPAKGPFSYSIEVDIDAYKKSLRLGAGASISVSRQDTQGAQGNTQGGSPKRSRDMRETRDIRETRDMRDMKGLKNERQRRGAGITHTPHNTQNLSRANAMSSASVASNKGIVASQVSPIAATGGSTGGGGFTGGYIHELREDILHPLVDSTNPRLNAVCTSNTLGKGPGKGTDKKDSTDNKDSKDKKDKKREGIPPWAVKSCEKVRARKYFSPSEYTIAVHMWTHTFLGWSFFRGLYNSGVYAQVERELVPSMRCPPLFRED